MMINEDGEEVYVQGETFSVAPPEAIEIFENISCNDEGIIQLKHKGDKQYE